MVIVFGRGFDSRQLHKKGAFVNECSFFNLKSSLYYSADYSTEIY